MIKLGFNLRQALVLVHRYVGLVMAGFLLVAGFTGSLLAWNDELDRAINPELFRAEPPTLNARPLDSLVLRALVQAEYAHALVTRAPLTTQTGSATLLLLRGMPDPVTGKVSVLSNDQIFVNPYTAEVLGERKWGDISQGMKNLMPFIYRLHYSLALGVVGSYIFGIIALLWTLDCFIGAYLTFPARRRRGRLPEVSPTRQHYKASWLQRWRSSWKVRWKDGGYKVNFDLHRAGGLWPWAMLLVLAWSSVAFNLTEVYNPVMRTVFAHQPDGKVIPKLSRPQLKPIIGWMQARDIARRLMSERAATDGFAVWKEVALSYDPARGIYRYDVQSDRDIRSRGGSTRLLLDASTAELKGLWLPTGATNGDTIYTWITSLHMAALWGLPLKILICLLGLAVMLLSITGVVIWIRKRTARMKFAIKRRGAGWLPELPYS